MQIITQAEIPSDLSHQSVFNRHADIVIKDHAQSLFDKNALRDNITSQPAPVSTDTTSVSEPVLMRPNSADKFKEHLENEEILSVETNEASKELSLSPVCNHLTGTVFLLI